MFRFRRGVIVAMVLVEEVGVLGCPSRFAAC